MGMKSNKKSNLQNRWLTNTALIVFALGLVFVLGVTAVFAAKFYSDMESDMKYLAREASTELQSFTTLDQEGFIAACKNYTRSFSDRDHTKLQLLDAEGYVIVNSYDNWVGDFPGTPEIQQSVNSRGPVPYVGVDPVTGVRSMAVSCPVLNSDGEIAVVLRFVLATRSSDTLILLTAVMGMVLLFAMLTVIVISSGYYIRSIMIPIAEITEKAKRIANGSYGTQIQTRYQDEIGALAETVNEMSSKISQNEKMQAEFISQLSHELRTPLTVINGWSETLLSDESMDDGTRQGMKIISSEAKRLTEMVMELLDFTRMQDGRMTLTVEPTDIRAEFEDTVYMYSSRLAQDGIHLHYIDNDDDIPEISCDPKRLRQVFLNIMDNAAKHGGEGKRVDASMTFEQDAVVVRIRDYGPGIPEDEIPLVKKKFYKGSSQARGTGIGLAVCDEIVELHGGILTLENAEGGGTLVTVRLPSREN
jgi:signal transduction histidine kinase